jgi:hypothetical protein
MAAAAALAIGAAAPAANAQIGTGTMNLHLGVPAGKTLTQTWVQTYNGSIGWNHAVTFGGGAGPFAVTGLPAADGHLASVVSVSTADDLCSGSDPNFPIATNGTTIVFVNLMCVPRSAVAAPAIGRLAPLLGLSLAALGAIALRRRARSATRGT